ncbi:MAG: helix-turn-helix transcriptional regulator [Myxococcales bacterium]|nr:helix-turn-helix transcriptional regulator [Myxococcales bacterium]
MSAAGVWSQESHIDALEPPTLAWQTIHRLAEAMGDPSQGRTPLSAFAAQAGYELTHFAKVFRQIIGEPPIRHARRRRLHAAALALEQTEASILEVAQSVGYRSHEAFARAFRRQFGMAPSAFREHPSVGIERGPSECPEALEWSEATVVHRSFRGVSQVVDPTLAQMNEALHTLSLAFDVGDPDALGAAADPWGWNPAEDPTRFRVVALTTQPPRPPWPPLWVPARDWLRVGWTGEADTVSAGIFWIHEQGLPQRGRASGFAPTLTFGHLRAATTIWIPLRPR